MTHTPYTQAGPPDGRGGYLSFTGCNACRQPWPCPSAVAEHARDCAALALPLPHACTCKETR